MSTKPNSVNILGVVYSIEYCDNPADVDIYKRISAWGQIDYWTRSIRIYDGSNRSREDIWQTIIHEILHAIEEELHLSCFDKDRGHDELDLISIALRDVLFRNGWIK